MNRIEYISQLEKNLKYLPKEDKEDAIAYYTEYIGDMELADGEDVEKKLGTPKDVAREILDNATVKAVETQQENKSLKGSGKIVWLLLLGIMSLPISLPITLVAAVVVITIFITLFVVYVAFFVTALAVVFSGFVMLYACFFAPGFGTKLICAGLGLVFIGLGVFFLLGCVGLGKLLIKLLGRVIIRRKVK